MAGTVSELRDPRRAPNDGKKVEIVKVTWLSDASGNATLLLPNLYGFLMKLITVPDGSAAPTALYDITLVDEFLVDALAGAGADRSATVKEQVYPTPSGAQIPAFLCGSHTFTVANAGNAKAGVAYLVLAETL